MAHLEQQFFNSCVTIDYPCTVGDRLIDPCNCGKFYLCEHTVSLIHQSCSEGTLFNHRSKNCERASDVVIEAKLCEIYNPWKRCDDDYDADLPALEERCTGISPTPGPTAPPPGGQTGDNTGAIVGAVIAVLLVIAIVVALVIFLRKRGKPVSHYLSYFNKKKTVVNNPEYDNKEETYSEIKDVMGSPVYNDTMTGSNSPRLPDRPSFTMSPALQVSQDSSKFKGRPGGEEVAYDNPGYTPSPGDDIIQGTTSLNVSRSSLQPPSLRTSKAEDDVDRQSTYSDLDRASLEVPVQRAYTPLSVYTRGPNPNASSGEGGIVQVRDTEYEVPRPMPEYYELQPESNCVT